MRKNWLSSLIVFSALGVFSGQVVAQDQNLRSDAWLDVCSVPNLLPVCVGYVQGIDEGALLGYAWKQTGHDITNDGVMGCPPPEKKITNGQTVKIWIQYLKTHPEKHQEPAMITLSTSMREAFPCHQK